MEGMMSATTCCGRLKEEFRLKNFGLGHENPKTFVQFQFGCQRAYLAWRVFWAAYHVAWIIVTGVRSWEWAGPDPDQKVKWFIYLTDWCFFLLTLSTLVDAAVVTYVFFRNKDVRKGDTIWCPWYVRVDWALCTLGNIASLVVSIAYWTLVYKAGAPITAVNIETHVINSVYVIVNVAVTGMPVRILHFWYGILFGIVYTLFSYIYYVAGGTNHNDNPYIYSALDWRKPGTAAMYAAIVAFVVCPIIHLVLYGIHATKLLVWNSFSRRKEGAMHMAEKPYLEKAGSL